MLTATALSAALLAASISLVSAANHTVVVGGNAGLVFTPESITADVDDFVTYIFQTKNHTVTQVGFAAPCQLLENATINAVGFDSGFVPVDANATEFPAWTIQVTAATPIWIACRQGNHCVSGMVGAINAPTSGNKTFEAFKALAMSNTTGTFSDVAGDLTTVLTASQTGINAGGVSSGTAGPSDVSAANAAAAASSTAASSSTSSGASATGNASASVKMPALGATFGALAASFASWALL